MHGRNLLMGAALGVSLLSSCKYILVYTTTSIYESLSTTLFTFSLPPHYYSLTTSLPPPPRRAPPAVWCGAS